MKENVREQREVRLRRAATALFAIAAVATGTVHASPPNPVVVVPPTDLPALARQSGDAMLLHETIGGRMMLDIEENQGARLATFDVTEPLRIKGEGSACPGELTVTHPTMDAVPALNFGAIDTVLSYELNRLFDVKQVRAQMTRTDVGSTCMLTENGLCPIWRPAVEWIHPLTEISSD